jgi:hypothetical protein
MITITQATRTCAALPTEGERQNHITTTQHVRFLVGQYNTAPTH